MKSVTLGQFQYIDIKIHPTFALVALWVIYHWGVKESGGAAGIAYGAALIIGIFLFVLLHEFGHSLMAREFGLRVRDITLVPFGGVARIEQMPTMPHAEALIAIAGPLVNLAVAVALFPALMMIGIASGFDSLGDYLEYGLGEASFGGFVFYLFLANLMIATFNLLPAFPMDGGRLLRAGLTPLAGRETATSIAVWVGVALGAIIAAVGLLAGDFLIAAIMIFVVVAGVAEGRSVQLEEAMRRLRVGQFAVWDRGGISPKDPIALAVREGPRDLAVTENGQIVGMVWRSQLIDVIRSGGLQRRVNEIMDPRVVTAEVDASVYDVHNLMNVHSQWSVPITEHGVYRGLFTTERFLHVQRFLAAQTPERRHVSAFAGLVSQTWKSWVR
jgi:Zn-dependent protease